MVQDKGEGTKQRKRKPQPASPQSRKLPKPAAVELSDSSTGGRAASPKLPDVDSPEMATAYEVGNSEFDAPFDLKVIPEALRDRMVAAAPMLLGRDAEYDDKFFHEKVGLCDRGPTVDEVPKVYPEILEFDIKKVWRPGGQPNWYEIANCTDKDQARIFSQHNYQVYGNRPDNAYFAMRYLKAAYATFVHEKNVNWVAEAQVRRNKRLATAAKNPKKLGPVALRRQVEGLCEIMAYVATGTQRVAECPELYWEQRKKRTLQGRLQLSQRRRFEQLRRSTLTRWAS